MASSPESTTRIVGLQTASEVVCLQATTQTVAWNSIAFDFLLSFKLLFKKNA